MPRPTRSGRAPRTRRGTETFFEDLFKNIEGFFVGLLEGLPQAVDRIVNEGSPKFVQAVIGNLPKIVLGFVTLAPRIAFAIVKAISRSRCRSPSTGFRTRAPRSWSCSRPTSAGDHQRRDAGVRCRGGRAHVGHRGDLQPHRRLLSSIFDTAGGLFSGDDSTSGRIGRSLGLSAYGEDPERQRRRPHRERHPLIGGLLHQGGMVAAPSNPTRRHCSPWRGVALRRGRHGHGVDSLARRRLSQVLSGDDIPVPLPREGVLTERGVAAAGGPQAVESMNRGNEPGAAQAAQIVLSTRVGGDAALAALPHPRGRRVDALALGRSAWPWTRCSAPRVPAFSGLT